MYTTRGSFGRDNPHEHKQAESCVFERVWFYCRFQWKLKFDTTLVFKLFMIMWFCPVLVTQGSLGGLWRREAAEKRVMLCWRHTGTRRHGEQYVFRYCFVLVAETRNHSGKNATPSGWSVPKATRRWNATATRRASWPRRPRLGGYPIVASSATRFEHTLSNPCFFGGGRWSLAILGLALPHFLEPRASQVLICLARHQTERSNVSGHVSHLDLAYEFSNALLKQTQHLYVPSHYEVLQQEPSFQKRLSVNVWAYLVFDSCSKQQGCPFLHAMFSVWNPGCEEWEQRPMRPLTSKYQLVARIIITFIKCNHSSYTGSGGGGLGGRGRLRRSRGWGCWPRTSTAVAHSHAVMTTMIMNARITNRNHYSQLASHEGGLSRRALNLSWAIMGHRGQFLTTKLFVFLTLASTWGSRADACVIHEATDPDEGSVLSTVRHVFKRNDYI